ncbi:uncharacterized protein EKO05_0002839 [Ascochyta rabiei]|uniref:Uncharacterized protein n=1 Tax=Didymella rabiei TaxID=5454 RepID=A0A163EHB8_DIDRA|nr:uncharacterized protein EKO05_0002839 [Ascochyta rabiei]KZM23698.1 hypothetical protein ST47_g5150 [Ascochyta rabiei]UPX12284.1 hypothetical protein EKO05_0002839 [Ascochyta rabiei]
MLVPFFIAAIAAIPAVQAQDVTASVTRCTTRFGMFPAPTGASLDTWYNYATTTNSFAVTSTTQETTTVTPSATTFTDVVNITSTFFTTSTSVPAAVVVPTAAGFFPLLTAMATPAATPMGRYKRALIGSRSEHIHKVKRQTAPGNTAGFIVSADGSTSNLNRIYPQRVVCRVAVTVNSTATTIVTGLPKTEVLVPATATAVSTATFSVTETIIEVVARPTTYAACEANNVVSHVPGFDNEQIYFDRIVFRPTEGFPAANSLVVNTTSAINCCIACQNQPFCAGSFYAPSRQACHLQLTQAAPAPAPPSLPASNSSLLIAAASGAPYPIPGNETVILYATASGMAPSGLSTMVPIATPISDGGMSIQPISEPASTGTPSNPGSGTCSIGSLSLYLGVARGQKDFPEDVALSFSNGPCGRMSIDFEAVTPETNDVIARRMISI